MLNIANIKLLDVPAPSIPEWWEAGVVRDMIEDACRYSGGRYMVSDILDLLLQQKMQLWVAMENHEVLGIGLTEIIKFPQLKECRVICATGTNVNLWAHFIQKIEKWAVLQGCEKMMIVCRPGWEKLMKEFNYKKNHVQLEKGLGYVH